MSVLLNTNVAAGFSLRFLRSDRDWVNRQPGITLKGFDRLNDVGDATPSGYWLRI